MKSLIKRFFPVIALLALFLAPSQFCVSVAGVRITPADLLLPLAFVLAFVSAGVRMLVPTLENALFLVFVAISAICGADRGEGVKEFVQILLYFYAAERIFSTLLASGEKYVRISSLVFLASGGVILTIAVIQYFLPDSAEFPLCLRTGLSVRGAFGNNNVLCGYLSLLLPFSFAFMCSKDCLRSVGDKASGCSCLGVMCGAAGCHASSRLLCIVCRVVLFLMVPAGLFVMFSGAAFVAVVAAMSVIAFRRNAIAGVGCAILITVAFFYLAPLLPRDNFTSLVQSTEIYHSDSGEVKYSEDGILTWNAGEPTRRYPEWQAALMMSFERPFVGIGPGMYQKQVGPYFDMIPRATGPCEPDIQNMYLVMVSSMGYPALIAFLTMLCSAICKGQSGDVAGVAAAFAVAAFAVTAIWHPLLVRGIGIPLVFMLSLARRTSKA